MTFAIDDAFLPATLSVPPMNDEEFAAFCAEHPELNFEMSAEGELIVMPPTNSDTGACNLEVAGILRNWARKDGRGIACDSSTGFVLPNGARRSPDASWTLKARLEAMGSAKRDSFWHLCPDFVIEVRPKSDRVKPLERKMAEYLNQGAQLGWLIDRQRRSVSVYRASGEVETLTGINEMAG